MLAYQSGRFSPRSGERTAARTDRVRAIGELDPAHVLTVLSKYQKVVDLYRVVAKLKVKRLSAVEMAGAGHDIYSGYSARLCTLNAGCLRIYAVENSHIRLDRCGRVGTCGPADMAVRIDYPRHDRFARKIDDHHVRRKPNCPSIADGGDLSVLYKQDPLFDRLSDDGDYPCVNKRDRLRLSQVRQSRHQANQKQQQKSLH